jgi:hypothetical protein
MMARALVLVLVAAALAGCGDDPAPYGIMPDAKFPSETLNDWVSHGDQLSVIRIVSETPPKLPREWKNSGGLLGRKVTVQIERTVWHRHGAPRRAGTFRMQAWGWMMENDQHADSPIHPIFVHDAPRLKVGGRYLAVLMRLRKRWTPLNDTAVMTLDGDTVTSKVDAGQPTAPAASLRGKTVAEAGAVLRQTD